MLQLSGLELTTMGLLDLACFSITYMPLSTCSNYFQKVQHTLFEYLSQCGPYEIGKFRVSVRISIENCMSIYFINVLILCFRAKNLNLSARFGAFVGIKIVHENVFSLNLNMQITKRLKLEKGFRLPIYHCALLFFLLMFLPWNQKQKCS